MSHILFCRRGKPDPGPAPLTTGHLLLPPDYYYDEANLAAAAALRQPVSIHPKYSDIVYRIVIGALALRSRLSRFMNTPPTCVFCSEVETYEHLFVNCCYLQDMWAELTRCSPHFV
ncbi:hypothetical protein ACHHYP_17126 [Achlya hypogyna]|uniref:Reverse transcriptase zinc-binding domain-containing protein n=1 Tax=Achlya hypogyna TaxID=1202772 RepID=A0A1V9Y550_ACHHY|nr:hypothetical protein ACHHYP_17126 [Achlya hypogyna]